MPMERYPGLSGDAGVEGYEILADAIILQFKDDGRYLYDGRKPGWHHVEAMKQLACAGRGLTTYVNQHVRGNYAARLDRK